MFWLRLVGLVLLFVCMSASVKPALAITAGTTCGQVTDVSTAENSGVDFGGVQILLAGSTCTLVAVNPIILSQPTSLQERMVIFLNSNNDGTPQVLDTFRIVYHASVTAVRLDGVAYVSGTQIPVATADNFSRVVTYTFGGADLTFTVAKAPGTNTLSAFTISAVVSGGAGPTAQQRTQRTVANFMGRRADQITASDPDLVKRLSGNGDNGTGGPVAFTGSGKTSNSQLAFSTSLRKVIASKEAAKTKKLEKLGPMMALGQQSFGANNGDDGLGFDLWIKGQLSHADHDTSDIDLGLLYIGADYRFSPEILFGFLAQFDWMEEDDSLQGTAVDGKGWMAGPYVVARLHQNLLFDARAAWGQSDNDIALTGTSTGSFDTTRWLAKGRLTGDFNFGQWHFAPHVGVIYFEDRQDSFTDSLGNVIASQTVSLGRVMFGPKVSYAMVQPDGTVITPHLAIKGIWDFVHDDTVNVTTGLAVGSDDVRARVEGGVSVRMANGWSIKGEGFYDGIGADDLDAYGGSVKLSVSLN